MQRQNPSEKHHYIPVFYLKRWHDPSDNKLIEFTKPLGVKFSISRLNAKSTGFQRRLYSLEGYEPETAQYIETSFFSQIESDASVALDMLERHGHRANWDSRTRSAWSRFLISLLLRCPEDIAGLRDWSHNRALADPGSAAEANYCLRKGPEHPETLSQYFEQLHITEKERLLFRSLCRMVDNGAVGTTLNKMEWRVFQSPPSAPSFLTSDRPVIRSGNLRGHNAHVALPIGPRLLFLASPDPDFLNAVLIAHPVTFVKAVNRQVVEAASRFVYGCDDAQQHFVEKHFGRNPQPRLLERIFDIGKGLAAS